MAAEPGTAKALFLAALEKVTPAERLAFLDESCAGDAALRQRVEALLQAHGQADSLLDQPAIQPVGAGEDPGRTVALNSGAPAADGAARTEAEEALGLLAPAQEGSSLGRLDHYEVLQVVGRGGMGLVFKARDTSLERVVAIKMLAPQLAASGTARKRFEREAKAAAAVSHEHVVAIHAVESSGPAPYLVMEFVAGNTLEERIKQGGPLEVKEILGIGMQAAQGLAAAHAQGLVHRDIKPGNILLENGVQRVKLTDFGLARAADDASLTQSGVIAGTPLYMSPEQARGGVIDHRTDLFSLGSVLYTLCTGHPPFRAPNTMAVLKRVCEDTPRSIRDINPDIPEWLEATIARLLAKDPAARFPSAEELADLLGQHLAHLQQPQLIPRPQTVTVGERAPRRPNWLIRTAVLAPAALLLAIVGAGIAYKVLQHGSTEPVVSGPGTDSKDKALTADERAKLPSPLDQRKRAMIPRALLALAGGGDPEQAPPELVALLGDGRFVLPGEGPTSWMAQSPDGKLLAVPRGSNVVLFDAGTGALVRTLVGRGGRAYGAFSPDGNRLASGMLQGDHTVTVWDVPTGALVQVLKGHSGDIWLPAFSTDGKRLVSGSSDRTTRMWDVEKGVELFTLPGPQGAVHAMTFSPDGRWVLTGSRDGAVKVWDARTGQEHKTLLENGDTVWTLAYSPNGKLLASGGWKRWKLWDAKTFEEVRSGVAAAWLGFSADGRVFLIGPHGGLDGAAHTVTRWDAASGAELGTFSLKSAGGWAVYTLSADTKTLFAMACDPPDPCVRAYDAATGKEFFPHQGHEGRVYSVAVSPDGRLLASHGFMDGTVRLWDVTGPQPRHQEIRLFPPNTRYLFGLALTPEGRHLAIATPGNAIYVLRLAERGKVYEVP